MWSPLAVMLQRTRFPSRPDVVMPVAAILCSALRAALGSMPNSARPLSRVDDQAGCPAGQTNSPIITSSSARALLGRALPNGLRASGLLVMRLRSLLPALSVGGQRLEGCQQVPAALGEAVADGDRRGRLDDPVDQPDLLEFLQAGGQHAVGQAVDARDDLGEPVGAASHGEQDAAVPAAADPLDD